MNDSNPTLRKAYKILRRIVKKLGRTDLHFSAQLGVDSSKDDNIVIYAAMIAAPREGLAPITFASVSKKDFIEKLEDFLKNKISEEDVELAYLNAQIFANKRSTEFYQGQIDKIENPEVKEAEIVESEEVEDSTETVNEDDVEVIQD